MAGKSSKILGLIVCLFVIVGVFRGCSTIFHEHEWQDATCTEPRKCASCGKTEGEPLDHNWQEATCLVAKTCSVCGATEGGRADHIWMSATCTEPEACSVCGKKRHWYSLSLGHDWEAATCTAPKTCSRCGETEGEPQHRFVSYSWDVIVEPTCQSEGERSHACTICGKIETETMSTIDHKSGDWQIVEEATPSADGIKKRYCEMCGLEMDTTQYKYLDLRGNGTGSNGGGSGSGGNFNTYNNEIQQQTTASYVLNTSTMKFHRPSCRDVPKIASRNYSTSSQSMDDLISRGYSPCGHCSP